MTVEIMRWPDGNYSIFDIDLKANRVHVIDVPAHDKFGEQAYRVRTFDQERLRLFIVSHQEFIQRAQELLSVLESNDTTGNEEDQ